jgi:lipopolysaccharide/colanic/teichoic acid biosynthesis glycosyltransferase
MSVPRISSIFKRVLDVSLSSLALLLLLPAILIFSLIIWIQDHGSPIYVSTRVGKDGHIFSMLKLRSMIIDAEKTKVDSTSSDDSRITPIGKFLRKTKLDELPQLWSVLVGDMSLVGPRPNVPREVQLYTEIELELLEIRPGLTDFASIVFADEGEILKGSENPDVTYNQIIRPYKSRLGLFYVSQ